MPDMSNLPPGVTPGMIPGNRPEDEWLDVFFEEFDVPPWAMAQWTPGAFADWLERVLDVIGEVDQQAYKIGVSEGRMDAHMAEAERQAYESHQESEARQADEAFDRAYDPAWEEGRTE